MWNAKVVKNGSADGDNVMKFKQLQNKPDYETTLSDWDTHSNPVDIMPGLTVYI